MKLHDARKLANDLLVEWRLAPEWTFDFDRAKQRFGCCKHSKKKITLSPYLTERNDEEKVRDTILHEIAHALDYRDRGTSDHSYKWKQWARKVGAKPTRCYNGDEVNGVEYKYYDYCPCCGNKNGRHKRRSKNKLIASCTKCGNGFNKNYLIIFNIPAEKMKAVENGELMWEKLPQANKVMRLFERHYDTNKPALVYDEYKRVNKS